MTRELRERRQQDKKIGIMLQDKWIEETQIEKLFGVLVSNEMTWSRQLWGEKLWGQG